MQTSGLGTDVDAAVAAVLASSERSLYARVLVDWLRNGTFSGTAISDLSLGVDNVRVDRALAGSAPQEVMLIEGSAAAELSFDLSGEFRHSNGSVIPYTAVFSPYNGLSPLYNLDPIGCEIKYAIGVETVFGVIWYDQFVGRIRSISPRRGANAVAITALDRAEELRVPVTFPKWAISSYHMARGWTLAQLCESQWVIDHCLRHGNTSTTGYRWQTDAERELYVAENPDWVLMDPGTQLWISGNGSYLPNVGQLDNSRSQGFPKTESGARPMMSQEGPIHPLVATETSKRPYAFKGMRDDSSGETPDGAYSANESRYWGKERLNFETEASHFHGFTLNKLGDPTFLGSTASWTALEVNIGMMSRIRYVINTGSIRMEVGNWQAGGQAVSPWYALPTGTDHIKVDGANHQENGITMFHLFLNGVRVTPLAGFSTGWNIWQRWVNDSGAGYDSQRALVVVRRKNSMSDIYWSNRNTTYGEYNTTLVANQSTRAAKYAAVLDRGMNRLTNIPVEMYDDAWQAITDVAAAELGAAFWDEKGVFRFWNRSTLLNLQNTVTNTINLDNASDLQITNTLDSVRNVITADTKLTTADRDIVFEASSIDEFYVPARPDGGFIEFTIYRDDISQVTAWKMLRRDSVSGGYPDWNDKEALIDGAYVVQWLIGGQWTERNDFTSGVDINARLDKNGNLVIRVWNGYTYPCRFGTGVNADGSPALRIMGTLMTPQPNAIQQVSHPNSIKKYGQRNLPLSGDWIQWQPSAVGTTLLDSLLPRTIQPIPTTENIEVAGDPRRQLGDTERLQDPDGLGEDMKVQVYGISRVFSKDNGLTDTLSVEMIKPPLIGIWDSPQYGLWDTTFYWSA